MLMKPVTFICVIVICVYSPGAHASLCNNCIDIGTLEYTGSLFIFFISFFFLFFSTNVNVLNLFQDNLKALKGGGGSSSVIQSQSSAARRVGRLVADLTHIWCSFRNYYSLTIPADRDAKRSHIQSTCVMIAGAHRCSSLY